MFQNRTTVSNSFQIQTYYNRYFQNPTNTTNYTLFNY